MRGRSEELYGHTVPEFCEYSAFPTFRRFNYFPSENCYENSHTDDGLLRADDRNVPGYHFVKKLIPHQRKGRKTLWKPNYLIEQ